MHEVLLHRYVVVLAFVVALVAMVEIDSALLNTVAQTGTPAAGVPALTEDEMQEIIAAAVATAEQTPSLLRVDGAGNHPMTRMAIAIVGRNGKLLAQHTMEDVWPVSIDVALAKAYTAAGLSSSENAMSSRSLGFLTQPGWSLEHR
jgi:uncharacterized protein GlcG (DUF336 family)